MKVFDEIAAAGIVVDALWQGHAERWNCRLRRGTKFMGAAYNRPTAEDAMRKALGDNQRSIEDMLE